MKVTERKVGGLTIIEVEPGTQVVCDFCNDDHTTNSAPGGCLVGSHAVCPKCSEKYKDAIDEDKLNVKYQEPREGETFRDFVLRIRQEGY